MKFGIQPVAVLSSRFLEGNIWLIAEVQFPSRTRLAELGCFSPKLSGCQSLATARTHDRRPARRRHMPSGIAGVLVVLQLGTLTAVQPSIGKESLGPPFVGVFKDLANQLLRYVDGSFGATRMQHCKSFITKLSQQPPWLGPGARLLAAASKKTSRLGLVQSARMHTVCR